MSTPADDPELNIDLSVSGMKAADVIDITGEPDNAAGPLVTESDIEAFFNTPKHSAAGFAESHEDEAAAVDDCGPIAIDLTAAAGELANGTTAAKDGGEAQDDCDMDNAEGGAENATDLSDPGGAGEVSEEILNAGADEHGQEDAEEYDGDEEEEDASGESDIGSEYVPDADESTSTRTGTRNACARAQKPAGAPKQAKKSEDAEEGQHDEPGKKGKKRHRGLKTSDYIRPQPAETEDPDEPAEPELSEQPAEECTKPEKKDETQWTRRRQSCQAQAQDER